MGEPSQHSRKGNTAHSPAFLSNLPFLSNPAFAIRRNLLERLRESLLQKKRILLTAPPLRLSAQCQTEFAVETAYLCREDFDRIWWVPGGCPAALPGFFAEIAAALRLPEAESREQARMIAAVRKHLAEEPRSLIIFDQVSDLHAVNSLLPGKISASVLITSAENLADEAYTAHEIPDFLPAESREFLTTRLGTSLTAEDDETAFHLRGVPMLLHLYAGCVFMEPAKRAALRGAVERVSEDHAHRDQARTTALLEYLLRETLTSLGEHEYPAFNLFALMAFMGPQPLYANFLIDGATHLPGVLQTTLAAPGALARIVQVLSRAGVARIGPRAFSIPALMQERFVLSLAGDGKAAGCEAALRFTANSFPFKEEHDGYNPQCAHLLGHASAVTTWAEVMGISLEDTGRLQNQLGLYLRACDQPEDAVKYYLHAVACGEAVLGENHPKVAVRVNNLGVVYRETGRLDEARQAFRRALHIIRHAYGPADPMLAMAMRNLVAVAEDSKNEFEMERTYRRALRVYADSLGQAHPYVHQCLSSLSRILRKRGDAAGAARCLDEALRCAQQCEPPDEEAVAVYARRLGRLLLRSGDAGRALEPLEIAVSLSRKLHGPADVSSAESLYELGRAQLQEKQLASARASFEEALQISEALRAREELQMRILGQLARVQRALDDAPGAAVSYQHICRILEATRGPQHPELAANLMRLGEVLEQTGRFQDAETCYTRVLQLETDSTSGDAGSGTLHCRLGAVKRALGDYPQAMEHLKQAISADMRTSGNRHPDVARDLLELGLVYNSLGDSSQAIGNLMRALSILEEQLGRHHARTVEARNALETLGTGGALPEPRRS
ncbi:MAG TPA: tetratricopeptide repeat protein [Candidatus Hydrogenedentes bacterium]|nr:tetratricopeptide repeat protein [Candidatus Hydrogenedentota bacterium]